MPGGALVYYAVIATMMVPGEVVLIGLFRVVNALGLIDSYLGMILPLAVNAVNFLLIYNYMRGPAAGARRGGAWWTGPGPGRCSGG